VGPVAPIDVAALRARLEQRFRVYDVQSDEHVVAFFIDAPRETLEAQFEELKVELKAEGMVPLLKYQGGEHAIYILRTPQRRRRGWKLNLVLFLLTLLTTTLAGAFEAFSYYQRNVDIGALTRSQYFAAVFTPTNIGLGFLTFALPLMTILTVHEMGHYVMTRKHGMEASLPFFIPVPPGLGLNIGTFGAFISMREPMPNRKALFDIGAAGPIAGFIVAVPVVIIGLALMAANPVLLAADAKGVFSIGTPLLYDTLAYPFHIPDNALTHPTAFAGWVGLFVTAINMLPAGQLDGGHIASAMFGDRAKYASYAAVGVLLTLGLTPFLQSIIPGWPLPGYDGWLFFALLIGLLGVRHPPTLNAVSTLDRKRAIIGWGTFVIGALCFTLVPIG
jgi:Zn-dependent protease